jgi:hypothetical protein
MPDPLTPDDLSHFLARGDWRRRFGASALASGQKLTRARQLSTLQAELLDTGDAEISGTVTEKNGDPHRPVIALWREESGIAFDSSCSCAVSTHCAHAAALLEHLAKDPAPRLETAIGGTPHAESMTQGKTLHIDPPAAPGAPRPRGIGRPPNSPKFLFRAERRSSDNERLAWLPERHAQAWALYGTHRVPLAPSGILPPIVTPEGKIPRDRARETEALNALYALDFLPGAEEPPRSLRKLERPSIDGTLWAVNRHEWPHEDFFWQRFRHEGVPALERRGWRYASRLTSDFSPSSSAARPGKPRSWRKGAVGSISPPASKSTAKRSSFSPSSPPSSPTASSTSPRACPPARNS